MKTEHMLGFYATEHGARLVDDFGNEFTPTIQSYWQVLEEGERMWTECMELLWPGIIEQFGE